MKRLLENIVDDYTAACHCVKCDRIKRKIYKILGTDGVGE
jgi:hypothetical protein